MNAIARTALLLTALLGISLPRAGYSIFFGGHDKDEVRDRDLDKRCGADTIRVSVRSLVMPRLGQLNDLSPKHLVNLTSSERYWQIDLRFISPRFIEHMKAKKNPVADIVVSRKVEWMGADQFTLCLIEGKPASSWVAVGEEKAAANRVAGIEFAMSPQP